MTKLPFIRSGAFVIPEMEPIISFVESKGTTLTHFLDADQKSDLRAYMSLTEHIFTNAEVSADAVCTLCVCWGFVLNVCPHSIRFT